MSKKILMVIIFSSPILFFVNREKIASGQVSKQVMSVIMADSFKKGTNWKIFPKREIVDLAHKKSTLWAEEVQIYNYLVSVCSNLFNLNLVITGRIISVFLYILLIYWMYKIALFFEEKDNLKNLSISVLFFSTLIPLFKIYAVSFMPDIGMMAFCACGINSSLRQKYLKSLIFFIVASFFKFFAVFSIFGVFIYNILVKRYRDTIFQCLALLPLVIFIAFVYIEDIPNPVTYNAQAEYNGHFGGKILFNLGFYSRLVTWLLIKNYTPILSLISIIGLIFLLKLNLNDFKKFIFSLLFSYTLFLVSFAKGHYIHDYYFLQFSLVMIFLASFVFTKFKLRSLYCLGIFVYSTLLMNSALKEEQFIIDTALNIKKNTQRSDSIFLFGDGPVRTYLLESGRIGKTLSYKELGFYSKEKIKEYLDRGRIDKLVIVLRRDWSEDIFKFVNENFGLKVKQDIVKNYEGTKLWILQNIK